VTGDVSVIGTFTTSTGPLKVGTAGYQADGDIKGAKWQEWGNELATQAIDARIEERAASIADEKIDARCVTDIRMAGWQEKAVWLETGGNTGWQTPAGWMVSDIRRGNKHQLNWGIRHMQHGWLGFGQA